MFYVTGSSLVKQFLLPEQVEVKSSFIFAILFKNLFFIEFLNIVVIY